MIAQITSADVEGCADVAERAGALSFAARSKFVLFDVARRPFEVNYK